MSSSPSTGLGVTLSPLTSTSGWSGSSFGAAVEVPSSRASNGHLRPVRQDDPSDGVPGLTHPIEAGRPLRLIDCEVELLVTEFDRAIDRRALQLGFHGVAVLGAQVQFAISCAAAHPGFNVATVAHVRGSPVAEHGHGDGRAVVVGAAGIDDLLGELVAFGLSGCRLTRTCSWRHLLGGRWTFGLVALGAR